MDDDESIINMVEVLLQKEQFERVYRAMNASDAVQLTKEIDPDLIVLDVMLPDSDGYEVCRKIREFSMAPIIFLSAKNEEIDKLLSFAVGGDEYLTKPFSPKELVARIRVALRRQIYYETSKDDVQSYCFGSGYCLDLDKKTLWKGNERVSLTAKEYALLECLILNRDITMTRDMLIQRVWGAEFDGYDNTVMVHIRYLREKIEDDPANPKYIKTVKGRGYYFDSRG